MANGHIVVTSGNNACGSPFMPSITMPYIRNPLLFNHSIPSTYWATVSWRTYLCHKNSPESILDNHKTKVPAPICGIHLYGYILVLCDLMDIPHTFQIPAYGLFADAVLGRKLFQRLFALYIVADNLSFIAPYSAIKTTAAVLAFISLSTASQTVPDHIFRPAEKAFF